MRLTQLTKLLALTVMASAATFAASASAAIIFDDFNVNEGHFAQQPSFAGQSNVNTNSTADRSTTGSFEGAGNEALVLNLRAAPDPVVNPARSRFLSGGGTMANNNSFQTTAGTDGFIGFYYKTTTPGLRLSLNLDGDTVGDAAAAGAVAEMDMSPQITVIADGNWQLAEFNLDAGGWAAVSGIGGGHAGGLLLDGTHTIDSIYIQSITASGSNVAFDFVAKSDSGSIAGLVIPEPSTGALVIAGVGVVAACVARRRRDA